MLTIASKNNLFKKGLRGNPLTSSLCVTKALAFVATKSNLALNKKSYKIVGLFCKTIKNTSL